MITKQKVKAAIVAALFENKLNNRGHFIFHLEEGVSLAIDFIWSSPSGRLQITIHTQECGDWRRVINPNGGQVNLAANDLAHRVRQGLKRRTSDHDRGGD